MMLLIFELKLHRTVPVYPYCSQGISCMYDSGIVYKKYIYIVHSQNFHVSHAQVKGVDWYMNHPDETLIGF